ncbi:MAG: hypothetical protein KDD47_08835 [Acidobacteria bacterium]|nr:hypothetical protein [Acidobacteriota bacterium]
MAPGVAANGGGGFLVGWTHVRHDGGENRDIFLRRFDGDGVPLTGELSGAVIPDRIGSELVSVSSDAAGDFVIAFSSPSLCCDFLINAYYKRFHADGTQKDSAHSVDGVNFGGDNFLKDVAVAPDGSFLLGWSHSSDSGPISEWGVYTRFVDSAGTADATVTQLSMELGTPTIAAAPNGGFLMAYSRHAQWLAADGTTTGPLVSLEHLGAGLTFEFRPLVLPSGMGVIVFADRDSTSSTNQILAQRIAPDGTLIGGAVSLTETPIPAASGVFSLDADVLPDGGFLVVWERPAALGMPRDIYARQFRGDGFPLSAEVLVNPSDFGDERDARVASTSVGRAVVVWQNVDGQDGDEGGIYGQRLSLVPTLMFADGFESGDVSAWSAMEP